MLASSTTSSSKEVIITLPYFNANKHFVYQGQKYSFNVPNNIIPLDEFLRFNPAVINYVLTPEDPKNSKKIVFTGQIWSLGNFSGELSLVDQSSNIETLGIIRYVKK